MSLAQNVIFWHMALTKTNVSITVNNAVLEASKRGAALECRSFSSLVEFLLWQHCQTKNYFRARTKAKASRKA